MSVRLDRRAGDFSADRDPPRILVVCGATATGKSDLAVEIAECLGGEVVGADSRQVYRHLDVGTAKPSPELRARVRHHLLDVVEPDAAFDVSDWRALALAAIEDSARRGKVAIVCGGTGLYLRSLLRGLFPGPPADSELRCALLAEEAADPGVLHTRLARLDPATAARIHPNDRVRTVRALEVYSLSGRPLSQWHHEHRSDSGWADALVVEVTRSASELHTRIATRAHAMVAAGLLDEVRELERRFDLELKAFSAIGYREARACLGGALPVADLADAIATSTRAYAKRQRVWLRGQMETTQIPAEDRARALQLAREFFAPVATRQGIG